MWIDYKQHNLQKDIKTSGVYKIIRKEDERVMSVGQSKDLYRRFVYYNVRANKNNKVIPHGTKDNEIRKNSDAYYIEIIERDIPEDELLNRETHWQRSYHTYFTEGGWDKAGYKVTKYESNHRNYNPVKHKECMDRRLELNPEKREHDNEVRRQYRKKNKYQLSFNGKMRRKLTKEYRTFLKKNFLTWEYAWHAYEIYEATVRS